MSNDTLATLGALRLDEGKLLRSDALGCSSEEEGALYAGASLTALTFKFSVGTSVALGNLATS